MTLSLPDMGRPGCSRPFCWGARAITLRWSSAIPRSTTCRASASSMTTCCACSRRSVASTRSGRRRIFCRCTSSRRTAASAVERRGADGDARMARIHLDLSAVVRDGARPHRQGRAQHRDLPGETVTAIAQTSDGVSVTTQGSDGATRELEGRYLIGADGGNSLVRRALGITYEDLGFDQNWLVIDAKEKRARPGLPAMRQFCEPEQPGVTLFMGPQHRRWSFMIFPGESAEDAMKPESVWRRLDRPEGATPDEFELIRVASYKFQSLYAETWRVGRVFLAGDAAHQMPPFLAQGLCSGFRDAHNLAWKLDLVLKGATPDAFLDSYMAERGPSARATIVESMRVGQHVNERDPEKVKVRDAQLLALQAEKDRAGGTTQLIAFRVPGFAAGFVARGGGPAAGDAFPQARVRKGAHEGALRRHRGARLSHPRARRRPGCGAIAGRSRVLARAGRDDPAFGRRHPRQRRPLRPRHGCLWLRFYREAARPLHFRRLSQRKRAAGIVGRSARSAWDRPDPPGLNKLLHKVTRCGMPPPDRRQLLLPRHGNNTALRGRSEDRHHGIRHVSRASEPGGPAARRCLQRSLRTDRRRGKMGPRCDLAGGAAFRARPLAVVGAAHCRRRHRRIDAPHQDRHCGSGPAAGPSAAVGRGGGDGRPDQPRPPHLRRRSQRRGADLRRLWGALHRKPRALRRDAGHHPPGLDRTTKSPIAARITASATSRWCRVPIVSRRCRSVSPPIPSTPRR